MSVLLDSVWDSYEVCIAFNHRPGLRYSYNHYALVKEIRRKPQKYHLVSEYHLKIT